MAMQAFLTIAVLAYAASVSGQGNGPALPTFEVASVKPNKSATGMTISFQTGRMRLIGVTARQLLVRAFGVQPFDVLGAPDWLSRDRFDVIAKAPEDATVAQMNLMLLSLLTDRFGLVARMEERESPVFFLTTARDDGRLGPVLKTTADPTCDRPPVASEAPGRGQPQRSDRCTMLIGVGVIEGSGQPLQSLVAALTNIVGRPVVDMTYLSGRYDFKLSYAPDLRGAGAAGPDVEPQSGDAPSIFTALQEQLGLKLERRRGPVRVVIVDRIQQPTAD